MTLMAAASRSVIAVAMCGVRGSPDVPVPALVLPEGRPLDRLSSDGQLIAFGASDERHLAILLRLTTVVMSAELLGGRRVGRAGELNPGTAPATGEVTTKAPRLPRSKPVVLLHLGLGFRRETVAPHRPLYVGG
jgi:hypothetical protein